MPDIRLQALPQATNLGQALAVGGESIYDLLDLMGRAFSRFIRQLIHNLLKC